MVYVHAGVVGGQSEEIIDGFVMSNDESGLQGSWMGRDGESGIMEYIVAVGTSAGEQIHYCHLHPLQAANCCRNSRLVVYEDDLCQS